MIEDKLLLKLIMENPLPYLFGRIIYGNDGQLNGLIIDEANDSFFKINKKIFEFKTERSKEITLNNPSEREFLSKLISEGKNKTYTYIDGFKGWYKVDVFYFGNEKIAICLEEDHKLGKQTRMLIEHLPIPAWCKDEHDRYIAVSQKYAQYMRLKAEEMIGKTGYELFSNHDASLIEERDKEMRESLVPLKYKIENDQFFGFSCCEYTKIPCLSKEGRYMGMIGYAMDLTYQKTYEWALDEKVKLFEKVSQHMNDVIIISVPGKDEGGSVVYVSPSYEDLFGVSGETLYESRLNVLEMIDEEYKYIIRDKAYDRILDETMRITRADGEKRWVWFRSLPVKDPKGNVIRRVAVFSDITDKQNKERELEQLRTEFFANISHEFRTPLNLIFSSLQMLELKLKYLDPETRDYYQKYMDIMRQNQSRLLKLVNNLIDCTKIDAGYMEFKPQNYDIVYFTESICQSVVSFVQQKQLTLSFDTQLEEHVVAFDIDKLETILLNLLSNSIKYNLPGGRIFVDLFFTEEWVKISVRDTGIGIPQDKKEAVFERFQQADSILTRYGEGSGIGLSLVKALVEMHGGQIELKSRVNQGSDFTVLLPNKKFEQGMLEYSQAKDSIYKKIEIEFSDIEI